ncbi:MAG: hypothetical protein EOM08_11250 [Clostridia bacterium]|nr:hypothetical protein [Clostridia bacterium]NCC76995.1 hypothetical protein [Clostridia bacterium]
MTVRARVRLPLVVLLLATLLVLMTACTQPALTRSTTAPVVTESGKYLSSSALAQQLALAIGGNLDIQTAFQTIPERQRESVTADQFQRYVLLLRKGVPGRIVSLVAMNDNQIETVRQQVLDRLPGQQELTARTIGFWLNIRDSGIIGDRIELYCQMDEEGIAYLDSSWISQILLLDDFTNLYFDAIDRQDVDSLSELLRHSIPDDLARQAISSRLVWFYRNQVETETAGFRLQTIRIDGLSFAEKLLTSVSPGNSMTRTIELIPQADGTFLVDDLLPSELNLTDTDILLDDAPVLRIGGDTNSALVTLYSVPFEVITGKPVLHDDSNCSLLESGKSLIQLRYEGLELTVEGDCYNNHSRWRGRVLSVRLTSDKFSLGTGLKVGMPASTLYAQYPFISVGDKVAIGQMESGEVALSAEIENGVVTSLRLMMQDA